ncbi:unnamed protein product [Gordionus sp. m RMFG-2023]
MRTLNLNLTLSPGGGWRSAKPCMKCTCSSNGPEMTMECQTCGTFSSPCTNVDEKAFYPNCCPRPCRITLSQNNNSI